MVWRDNADNHPVSALLQRAVCDDPVVEIDGTRALEAPVDTAPRSSACRAAAAETVVGRREVEPLGVGHLGNEEGAGRYGVACVQGSLAIPPHPGHSSAGPAALHHGAKPVRPGVHVAVSQSRGPA
jgi:hypothetical protein